MPEQMSITLPHELADAVRAKVTAGQYANESAVISESLHALFEHENALEHWLHAEVAPALDALKADPSRARTAGQVRARLAAARTGAQ